MATVNLQASMPKIEIVGGMKLRLTAISPTTGAEITGVTASLWSVYGLDLSDLPDGPDEVPRLQPYEVDEGELV